MALQTKEIDGSTNRTGLWDFRLYCTENSINDDDVTSSVTVEPRIYRETGTNPSYISMADITCWINVTGSSEQTIVDNFTKKDIAPGDYMSLGSRTFAVPHNDDGTKTVTISASFTSDLSPQNGSASGEMTLTTIEVGTIRIAVNGEYKRGTPYVGVNGQWKKAKAYIGVSGQWKKGK